MQPDFSDDDRRLRWQPEPEQLLEERGRPGNREQLIMQQGIEITEVRER